MPRPRRLLLLAKLVALAVKEAPGGDKVVVIDVECLSGNVGEPGQGVGLK